MHRFRMYVILELLLVFSIGFFGARAMASTPFAITATNVTISNGSGSSQYTVSGFEGPGFVTLSCTYKGTAPASQVPLCITPGSPGVPIADGETTFSGAFEFLPPGSIVPAKLHRNGALPLGGLALAGALLFGIGLRRSTRNWLTLALLAVGTLAGVAGISACSGGSGGMNGVAPGTYQYAVGADFNPANTNLLITTGTTISVTVP